VKTANESLRKDLGDMTVVIAAKDREIDRLANSPCDVGKEVRPSSPQRPDRRKGSKSNAASEHKIALSTSAPGVP
jgi:hypothetical protein